LIDSDTLKGYIRYAREKIKPVLNSEHHEKIKEFYGLLREESVKMGGINIAVRHI
jgi:DNA replicative helicase MCM subunit Mcm2 (Cdc46/Mcm family)